jgi:polysaccharide biosynthesis protein PslG
MKTFSCFGMLCVVLLLNACIPQTPIPVYITPTPQQAPTSALDGGISFDVTQGVTRIVPTSTATHTATTIPTQTSTYTAAPAASLTATATVLGAIVPSDYTPPPTFTPLPTWTPPPALPQPTAPPALDAGRIGVQIDGFVAPADWQYALDRTSQLGVGWAKFQLPWNQAQPEGAGIFGPALTDFEKVIEEADRRGFRVMISIAKAPNWARSNPTLDGPPDDLQALADFLTFYLGTRANLFIDAIEIWNEPNLVREWGGQPLTGASYMRYFDAAYRAIRAANPNIVIISAGLAPTGETNGSRDDRAYLQEMYDAGLGNYRDIMIGVHPYSWGNPPDTRCCNAVDGQGWDDDPHFFFANTLEDTRAIMDRNGHQSVQMWLTEFGWAVWQGFPGQPLEGEQWKLYNTPCLQMTYTLRAFAIGQARSDIGVMVLWNLNFGTQSAIDRGDERATYSLMPAFGMRPLFWGLARSINPAVQPDNPVEACA